MQAPCVFLWGFLQMLWSPCVFLCMYVVASVSSVQCVCFAVDPCPSLKCGLNVPDSCHWVISVQDSVLVINFTPQRQRNMIEIAKEKTEIFS